MEIKELKLVIADAIEDWALGIVDSMTKGNPQMLMAGVYIKNGIRNYKKKKDEEIRQMINNAMLFIADEKGEVNVDTLFRDLTQMVKDMDDIPFDWGLVSGKIGKGTIRFDIPDNWLTRVFFGDKGSVVLGEEDFNRLKNMMA